MKVNIRQLDIFCESWLRKAKAYERPRSTFFSRRPERMPDHNRAAGAEELSRCFDRFTSLFVVFNRVYTEVGKLLIRRGVVQPHPHKKYAPLPDRQSATVHVVT